MRITKWGEYSVLCCLLLARHFLSEGESASLSATDIAHSQHIPLQNVHQILLKLKNGNIIESVRGPKGGYRLRKSPAEISLRDVIFAAEGEAVELLCESGPVFDEACQVAGRCGLKSVWFELREAVNNVLLKHSLQNILANHDSDFPGFVDTKLVQIISRNS